MPNLLIIGPQGSGKGTQGTLLAIRLGIPHVSTGDIFRANVRAKTELGLECRSYMNAGELVPDTVTSAMVSARLIEPDTQGGFLLDGFPRTVGQAETLTELLGTDRQLTTVLVLEAPDTVLADRMLARERADDTIAAINRRLELFRNETAPLLELYAPLIVSVNGVGSVDVVHERIWTALTPPATL